ncbi:STAS domain-containing protein [Catenuloplanes sp. NPDC051500]|uniref:STAS domain-containing protein n=1 Tax=Catenuloplanes sp. NPDC051500 TaxID=3363959 RepID=UPI00378AEDA0
MEITCELSPDSAAHGPLVVVSIEGEVDYTNADEITDEIWNVLAEHAPAAIRIDLEAATFIDSTGLGALIAGYRAAADANCAFSVASPSPAFRRVLAVTGLSALFGVESPETTARHEPQRTGER